MMRQFCTYFDQHYLPRGLALHASLQRHCPQFKLWILCMDDACHAALSRMDLPHVALIRRSDFEENDHQLARARQNRSSIEYFFTCTPSLPLFILNRDPEVDCITYVDADIFLFDSPDPVFSEMGSGSVAMTAHRFPPALSDRERFGHYNVGWLSFRRDTNGLACLKWWRERCNEWCYDRFEGDRFADQKYLEQWPQLFSNVIVLKHKGVNVAPWNISNYKLRMLQGHVRVDEVPLIAFHFHGLKTLNGNIYNPSLAEYHITADLSVRRNVYAPYIKELYDAAASVAATSIATTTGKLMRTHERQAQPDPNLNGYRRFKKWWYKQRRLWRGVAARDYFLVLRGRIIR